MKSVPVQTSPLMPEFQSSSFNAHKTRLDVAKGNVMSAILHLLRPKDGFKLCSTQYIKDIYDQWIAEEKLFYSINSTTPPFRVFPRIPIAAEQPCYRMWALLIQEQVEGSDGQAPLLAECVAEIMGNYQCAYHKSACSCKLSISPWRNREHMQALAPLKLKHNDSCFCGGNYCAQAYPQPEAKPEAKPDIAK